MAVEPKHINKGGKYMKNKFNKYHQIGTLAIALGLVGKRITVVPDFLLGFCMGLGIALIIIGIFAYKYDITGLRKFKLNLLKKVLEK